MIRSYVGLNVQSSAYPLRSEHAADEHQKHMHTSSAAAVGSCHPGVAGPRSRLTPRSAQAIPCTFSCEIRWAVLGNVVYAVSQYSMLVVLARVGTPVYVGQYALALAISGPTVFFCNLQLRALLASDAGRTISFPDYWRLRILTAPFAWAIITAIAFAGRFGSETTIVIIVAGGAKSLETLSDLCFGASQRDNRLDLVGKSLTVKGPLSLVFLGTVTWATHSLAFGLFAVALAWLALLLAYDLPNVHRCDSSFTKLLGSSAGREWRSQRQLIAVGLPLGASIALLTLTVGLPNILVARHLGESDVGIYAALTSLAWAGVPLINALGQTTMAKLGEFHVSQDYRRLRIAVLLLTAMGAGLGAVGMIGVWFAGDLVIGLFYGQGFLGHNDVLMWLMAAAAILYASRFVADALTAMRRTHGQLVSQGVAALVVLGGGVLVLPRFGLMGIAQVLTVACALRGAILAYCFIVNSSSTQSTQSYCKQYCR
jgi:O-antigen/teichoic acid export membrane protein